MPGGWGVTGLSLNSNCTTLQKPFLLFVLFLILERPSNCPMMLSGTSRAVSTFILFYIVLIFKMCGVLFHWRRPNCQILRARTKKLQVQKLKRGGSARERRAVPLVGAGEGGELYIFVNKVPFLGYKLPTSFEDKQDKTFIYRTITLITFFRLNSQHAEFLFSQ